MQASGEPDARTSTNDEAGFDLNKNGLTLDCSISNTSKFKCKKKKFNQGSFYLFCRLYHLFLISHCNAVAVHCFICGMKHYIVSVSRVTKVSILSLLLRVHYTSYTGFLSSIR